MTLHLVIRVIHVLLGAFWAGAAMLLALFIVPAVEESGPAGGAVMQALMRRSMLRILIYVGVFTVLTGIFLLWEFSGHFSGPVMGSPRGILLSVGALFGIVALLVGVHVSRPTATKLEAVGKKVAESGAPPTPEDATEMARLRGRLAAATRVVAALLMLTVVCMALGPHV